LARRFVVLRSHRGHREKRDAGARLLLRREGERSRVRECGRFDLRAPHVVSRGDSARDLKIDEPVGETGAREELAEQPGECIAAPGMPDLEDLETAREPGIVTVDEQRYAAAEAEDFVDRVSELKAAIFDADDRLARRRPPAVEPEDVHGIEGRSDANAARPA
jgi:hypothetical protein